MTRRSVCFFLTESDRWTLFKLERARKGGCPPNAVTSECRFWRSKGDDEIGGFGIVGVGDVFDGWNRRCSWMGMVNSDQLFPPESDFLQHLLDLPRVHGKSVGALQNVFHPPDRLRAAVPSRKQAACLIRFFFLAMPDHFIPHRTGHGKGDFYCISPANACRSIPRLFWFGHGV